jgi:hypothetical protein
MSAVAQAPAETTTAASVQPAEKIINILQAHKGGKSLVSLEYFPPRTEEGVQVGPWRRCCHWCVCVCVEMRALETDVSEDNE